MEERKIIITEKNFFILFGVFILTFIIQIVQGAIMRGDITIQYLMRDFLWSCFIMITFLFLNGLINLYKLHK